MKKIFSCILTFISACGYVSAERVNIGQFYYDLNSSTHTAEVTYQEGYGLNNYSYLTNATIPPSIKYNGVDYAVTSIGYVAFYNSPNLISVDIPNSVTTIGTQSCQNCKHLAGVSIPNSISIIGDLAFTACSSLTTIEIPYGVTILGENVFNNCTSLKNVTIPYSVTSVPGWAFFHCISLDSITIPDSVAEIGYAAFAYCDSLSYVQFPKNLTDIGAYAFESCIALQNISIPDSVKTIKMSAFVNCNNITTIKIPNATTIIETKAFSGCSNLDTITNYAEIPQKIYRDVFDGVNKQNCILYVPSQSIDLYREADVWREFFNILPIPRLETIVQTNVNEHLSTKTIFNGHVLIQSGEKKYTITGTEIK